jgi:hypothetical protein
MCSQTDGISKSQPLHNQTLCYGSGAPVAKDADGSFLLVSVQPPDLCEHRRDRREMGERETMVVERGWGQ